MNRIVAAQWDEELEEEEDQEGSGGIFTLSIMTNNTGAPGFSETEASVAIVTPRRLRISDRQALSKIQIGSVFG